MSTVKDANVILVVLVRAFIFLQITAVMYLILLHYYGHEEAVRHAAYFYTMAWCYQVILLPRLGLGLLFLSLIGGLTLYLRMTLGFPDGVILSFIVITSVCTVATVILLLSVHILNAKNTKKEEG